MGDNVEEGPSSSTHRNDNDDQDSSSPPGNNRPVNEYDATTQHLMSLFQPPPPTPANTLNASEAPKANGRSEKAVVGPPGSGADALLSMFSAPAEKKTEMSPSTSIPGPSKHEAESLKQSMNAPSYGSVPSTAAEELPETLLEPPPPPPMAFEQERRSTLRIGNQKQQHLLEQALYDSETPIISSKTHAADGGELESLLVPPRVLSTDKSKGEELIEFKSSESRESLATTATTKWKTFRKEHLSPSSFIGSIMFLLYHIVFVLAMSSAITRPSSTKSVLGIMAKLSTIGILIAGPVFVARLGRDVPAIYPTVDLFLAPFIARAAQQVDEALVREGIHSDTIFFSTFAVLSSIGMFFAGGLLLLAAKFKLANLGSYLPYSVLCGFFSAVGFLMWALSFSVDTGGKKWQEVFFSGDWSLIEDSLRHHIPSLVIGVLMNRLGPKHPFYVILLSCCTLVTFYLALWFSGTSLEQAQEAQWFWSEHELVYDAKQKVSTNWICR